MTPETLASLTANLAVWETQMETRAEIVRQKEDELLTAKQHYAIAVHNVEGIKRAIERMGG